MSAGREVEAHVEVGTFALDGTPDPLVCAFMQRKRAAARRYHRRVDFLKHDQPARLQRASELTKGLGCVALIHEHAPTHDGVEQSVLGGERAQIRFDELDRLDPELARSLPRDRERFDGTINADDPPLLAHQLGEHERDSTMTTADVEHTHAASTPASTNNRSIVVFGFTTSCLTVASA